jgi:hypothetical protein
VTDASELAKISLMRHIYRIDPSHQKLQDEIINLNESYSMIGSKLKGVGELFEQQNNNIVVLVDQGRKILERWKNYLPDCKNCKNCSIFNKKK